MVSEIGRLSLGWRRVQAIKVSLGVVTANGVQDAFLQIKKKRRPSYRQAAHAASIAREFVRHFASRCQYAPDRPSICALPTGTGTILIRMRQQPNGHDKKACSAHGQAPPCEPHGILVDWLESVRSWRFEAICIHTETYLCSCDEPASLLGRAAIA